MLCKNYAYYYILLLKLSKPWAQLGNFDRGAQVYLLGWYYVQDKVLNMLRPYLETCPQPKYEMWEGARALSVPLPSVAPLVKTAVIWRKISITWMDQKPRGQLARKRSLVCQWFSGQIYGRACVKCEAKESEINPPPLPPVWSISDILQWKIAIWSTI